jgi:hypothetical protein
LKVGGRLAAAVPDRSIHLRSYAMKSRLLMLCLFTSLACLSGAASAKGCLKGAAVGGVAGHVVGNHGLLGAAAGCGIGHHQANKKDAAQKDAAQAQAPTQQAAPAK